MARKQKSHDAGSSEGPKRSREVVSLSEKVAECDKVCREKGRGHIPVTFITAHCYHHSILLLITVFNLLL